MDECTAAFDLILNLKYACLCECTKKFSVHFIFIGFVAGSVSAGQFASDSYEGGSLLVYLIVPTFSSVFFLRLN